MQKLIIYAGDNDLGDGKTPEEVIAFFKQLETLIVKHIPIVRSYFISIKPSITRWNINDNIKTVNTLIKKETGEKNTLRFINIYDAMLNEEGSPDADYFDEDGLHLSEKGYKVWKQILLAQVFADNEG